jgi:hypothetical protein
MVKVLRADRSPLNKHQWLCELECGHEQWVTSARKPSKTRCYECNFPLVATPNNACSGQLAGAGKSDGESTPSATCH